MPPGRPVTLGTAGRLLTGPPEGYGRKQEVKVKRWIDTLPASPGKALGAEPSSISTAPSEVGGPGPGCPGAIIWLVPGSDEGAAYAF